MLLLLDLWIAVTYEIFPDAGEINDEREENKLRAERREFPKIGNEKLSRSSISKQVSNLVKARNCAYIISLASYNFV